MKYIAITKHTFQLCTWFVNLIYFYGHYKRFLYTDFESIRVLVYRKRIEKNPLRILSSNTNLVKGLFLKQPSPHRHGPMWSSDETLFMLQIAIVVAMW